MQGRSKRFLGVVDNPQFVRDSHSKGIIHTDDDEWLRHKEERAKAAIKDKRLNNLEDKVNRIESLLETLVKTLTDKEAS